MDLGTVIQPDLAVVPLFSSATGGGLSHEGTAFFVNDDLLVTCAHCTVAIGQVMQFGVNEPVGAIPSPIAPMTTHPATVVAIDKGHDVALLRVAGFKPGCTLSLCPEGPIHTNQLVACHEHSTTRRRGGTWAVSPASRLGNVTRVMPAEAYSGDFAADAIVLELSFPALRGASGAPVMYCGSHMAFSVVGMVIGNIDIHLLPAQIHTVLDEKNQEIVETKYLLPQGVAIHARHVRAAMNQVPCTPSGLP
ncbi:MAG: serine protease [Myxococcota bacterium]